MVAVVVSGTGREERCSCRRGVFIFFTSLGLIIPLHGC